ncbi:MAG: histidine phosphatase family protein [Desulfobacterales bacterium]
MVKTEIPQHAGTRISLVRHGSVQNPSHIFYGRLPGFSLSKKGRREAAVTALALKNLKIEELFSSPLLRCRQSAGEIRPHHPRLKLRQSRLITEVFTPFQGLPSSMVRSRGGDVYTGIDPEYEQPEDILKRVQKFLFRTRRTCSGKHVVAVTHGDVILFMVLWAGNFAATPKNKKRFKTLGILEEYPATSSVTTFSYTTDLQDERPSIAYFNPAIHMPR